MNELNEKLAVAATSLQGQTTYSRRLISLAQPHFAVSNLNREGNNA